MCEINPKRKQFYRLEFFTSHPMSDEEWDSLVTACLLILEQSFNSGGRIRVHIHEEPKIQGDYEYPWKSES